MKRASALGTLWCLAACGAPELSIEFQLPDAYRTHVDSVTLQIYEPTVAAPFTCDALAFGDADPDVVRVSQIGEIVARPGSEVALPALDRISPKIFVAEGRASTGERVVVGCEEVGEIDGDLSIRIHGMPTTRVMVVSSPPLSPRIGEPLPGPIMLRVVDFLGAALASVNVRFDVEAAGGTVSRGSAVTDDSGEVSILPDPPGRAGPFLLDVAVRWAESDPDLISGFVRPIPEVIELPGRVLEYRAGMIGPKSEPGLVALLLGDEPRSSKLAFVYRAATGELLMRISQSVLGNSPRLGLLDHPGTQRDRAIVVTTTGWTEVSTDGALTPRPYSPPLFAIGSPPAAVQSAGACPEEPNGPQVIITYDGPDTGIFDGEARQVTRFGSRLDVLASGCVSNLQGGQDRTLVIDGGAEVGLVVAVQASPESFAVRNWFAVAVGMSFARPVGNGRALLLGTQLNVNDFVVSRLFLDRAGDDFELVMEGVDSPPEIPLFNLGADLDSDGNLDIVSLFATQDPRGVSPPVHSIWAVLGRPHPGQRILGAAQLDDMQMLAPELLIVDLDRDGFDDIIVANRTGLVQTTARSQLTVYSMGLVRQ